MTLEVLVQSKSEQDTRDDERTLL